MQTQPYDFHLFWYRQVMKFSMILGLEGCFEREMMAGLPLPAVSVKTKDTVWTYFSGSGIL